MPYACLQIKQRARCYPWRSTRQPRQKRTSQEKHPPAKPVNPSAVLEVSEPLGPHPAIFDSIDGDLIRQVTIRMNGAAGPSGLDAASWKRLCTSFRAHFLNLSQLLSSFNSH